MTNQETSIEDFFSTELTANVSAVTLSFPVDSVGGLTSPCYIIINPDGGAGVREIILADGVWGASTFTASAGGSRGLGVTSAVAHDAGAPVVVAPLSFHIEDLNDRVDGHVHDGAESVQVDHNDLTSLGADDHTQYLLVDGTREMSAPIVLPAGTAALPAYTFSGDPDTGVFQSGADSLGLSAGGAENITVNVGDVTFGQETLGIDGLQTIPTYSFASDPDTGMYLDGAGILSFTTGGTERGRFASNGAFRVSDGSVDSPAVSFLNDTNTGIYSPAADQVSIVTGGSTNALFGNNFLPYGQVLSNDGGDASAPSYSFNGDPNTGMFRSASDDLGFTTGGIATFGMLRSGNESRLYARGDTTTYLAYNSNNGDWRIVENGTEEFLLDGVSVYIPDINTDTTGSAANVNVIAGGRLRRSVSLRANKQDITPLATDGWQNLSPITYRSKIEADDQTITHVGLIAEEVEEAFPMLATYDEGKLTSVNYDRVGVLALAVAKSLEARVAALEAR